ncbi:unnamed protein product, partial [Pylaiella littoralis]
RDSPGTWRTDGARGATSFREQAHWPALISEAAWRDGRRYSPLSAAGSAPNNAGVKMYPWFTRACLLSRTRAPVVVKRRAQRRSCRRAACGLPTCTIGKSATRRLGAFGAGHVPSRCTCGTCRGSSDRPARRAAAAVANHAARSAGSGYCPFSGGEYQPCPPLRHRRGLRSRSCSGRRRVHRHDPYPYERWPDRSSSAGLRPCPPRGSCLL